METKKRATIQRNEVEKDIKHKLGSSRSKRHLLPESQMRRLVWGIHTDQPLRQTLLFALDEEDPRTQRLVRRKSLLGGTET